jgi:hypothetical protein
MAPRNNVDKLPDGMRDKAISMLKRGAPIREITAFLNQLADEAGIDGVSKSGVGRWVAGQEEMLERLRRATALGEVWGNEIKNNPEGKASRLAMELCTTAILDNVMAPAEIDEETGEKKPMDPLQLYRLTAAIGKIEAASTLSVEREKQIRKQVKEQAAEAAAGIAKEQGLSADAVAEIRKTILGISS